MGGGRERVYKMGVFLCLGQEIHAVKYTDSARDRL
jgi:hypothetical protein